MSVFTGIKHTLTHRALLKQLYLKMTFDLWSGHFRNMLSNLVGPSYPRAKFALAIGMASDLFRRLKEPSKLPRLNILMIKILWFGYLTKAVITLQGTVML